MYLGDDTTDTTDAIDALAIEGVPVSAVSDAITVANVNPAILVGGGILLMALAYSAGTGRSTRVSSRQKRYVKAAKRLASFGL